MILLLVWSLLSQKSPAIICFFSDFLAFTPVQKKDPHADSVNILLE